MTMQRLMVLLVVLLLWGCNYKPYSHYSKKSVGEKVSTEVVISLVDPENTVIIKDALDKAVITVFHAEIVPKGKTQTHLIIDLKNVLFTPIRYDTNGFIIEYLATVSLQIIMEKGEVKKYYNVEGIHEFAIEPNAVISDQSRFYAIKAGTERALESFIAQASAAGSRVKEAQ